MVPEIDTVLMTGTQRYFLTINLAFTIPGTINSTHMFCFLISNREPT